jgi:hypothetical protein
MALRLAALAKGEPKAVPAPYGRFFDKRPCRRRSSI